MSRIQRYVATQGAPLQAPYYIWMFTEIFQLRSTAKTRFNATGSRICDIRVPVEVLCQHLASSSRPRKLWTFEHQSERHSILPTIDFVPNFRTHNRRNLGGNAKLRNGIHRLYTLFFGPQRVPSNS